jgi:hypothetical protein
MKETNKLTQSWVNVLCFTARSQDAASIDCFKCVSINGNNIACEDPFHNNYSTSILQTPCWAGRKERNGVSFQSIILLIIAFITRLHHLRFLLDLNSRIVFPFHAFFSWFPEYTRIIFSLHLVINSHLIVVAKRNLLFLLGNNFTLIVETICLITQVFPATACIKINGVYSEYIPIHTDKHVKRTNY